MSSIELIVSSPSIALPLLDTRQYRIIRLPNNLEACLIHDPDTDKAAASMDVNVGNYSDPEEIPGLAHCLEHALFMGTKKYPKENEYREYLAANAGHSNAWTNQCSTNYHFEVAASSSAGPESAASDQEQDIPPPQPVIDRPNDDDSSSLLSSASFSLSETSSVTDSNCGCHPDSPLSSPLYGALDRFAQFFIAPLFLESSLQRELHAVDSENKKNFQNDAWRLRQLSKTLSNLAHPYHKFICGNLETLRDSPAKQGLNIREEFMRFHEREYSAHKMKLVVLGREALDTLQEWVVHLFADIPDESLSSLPSLSSTPLTDTESYTPCHLSKLITVTPVMSRHELHIRFTYQDEDHLSVTQPGRYLMHLIGHEGPGSILSTLKSAGWANNFFAGPHPEGPGNAFFMVYIHLTEQGVRHYEDVVKVVFAYLSLLRREGVQRRIWEEIRALAEVEFKWKAKSQNVMGYVSMLANRMHKPLKREELISGYDLLTGYDEEALRKAIELLRPERCNLTLVSGACVREKEKMGLSLQREKWYGTEYIVEDIPERLMQEMKSTYQGAAAGCTSLHLPNPNPFIPSDLVVNRDVQEMGQRQRRPDLLINNSHICLWHKKDDTFFVPKTIINLLIRSPLLDPAAATLANTVIAEVYCKLVTDALTEYSYDAALTGYTYSLQPLQRQGGIHISVSGYSDKIYTLLDKILTTFKELDVRETQFERVKEEVEQDYKNKGYTEPFRQAGDVLAYLVSERAWTVQEKLATVQHAVVLSDIHTFKMGFLSQPTHFEWLIHGNVTSTDAASIAQNSVRLFTLTTHTPSRPRDISLPPGNYTYHHLLPDPANTNNCIEYALQLPHDISHPRTRARAFLLALILEEPAFDQLRTREQLGYIVFSGTRFFVRSGVLFIRVQSERECTYLEERIEVFLKMFGKNVLSAMTEQVFQRYKASLETQLRKKWENLAAEERWYWERIVDGYYDFERREADVRVLQEISREEMLEFFEEVVGKGRRKVAVHLDRRGSDGAKMEKPGSKDEDEEICDVQGFKAAAWLMPAPRPVSAVSLEMKASTPNRGRSDRKRSSPPDREEEQCKRRR